MVPPWYIPPEITISANKDIATLNHSVILATEPEALNIYSDGSGINGEIGSAAVALSLGIT